MKDYYKAFLENKIQFISVCGSYSKIFKRELIENNEKLRFDTYQICEDYIFNMKLISRLKSVFVCEYNGYCYVYREGSLTNKNRTYKMLSDNVDSEIYCAKQRENLGIQFGITQECNNLLLHRLRDSFLYMYAQIEKANIKRKERNQLIKRSFYIFDDSPFLYKGKEIQWKIFYRIVKKKKLVAIKMWFFLVSIKNCLKKKNF